MTKIFILQIVAAALTLLVGAADAQVIIGRGCTTATFIDEDCDGFGVAAPAGPDADDADPGVNTPASMLAAYGTLRAFLQAVKGLDTPSGRIFYLSPTGDDATGQPDDPNRPYATWNGTGSAGPHVQVRGGDVVVYRAGRYRDMIDCNWPTVRGADGAPILVLAYPGERVVLESTANAISVFYTSDLVFDGFIVDNPAPEASGHGIAIAESSNIVVRNVEVRRFVYMTVMEGLRDITIEGSVIHHMSEHGLYLGTRELPGLDIFVRRNLIYANGFPGIYGGFQFNGRVTNLIVEENVIHSNANWGISLKQGVSRSIFRNNLIFNNFGNGIIFHLYTRGVPFIPYAQNDNLFANNTIWLGRFDPTGTVPMSNAPHGSSAVVLVEDDEVAEMQVEQHGNVFRNNIFVTSGGPTFLIQRSRWAAATVFENNVVHRLDGPEQILQIGRLPTEAMLDWTGFRSFSGRVADNQFADPRFTDASLAYYAQSERFDLTLAADSPALEAGAQAGSPLGDLRGLARIGRVDVGAYERQTADGCAFTLSAAGASSPASGLVATLSISPAGGACAWTAMSRAAWITITDGSSGLGAGTVGYAVAKNPATSTRVGVIAVGGQTFTITQGGQSSPPTVAGGASTWYLAEGATGFFDEELLIANPSAAAATVTISYLLPVGPTVTRSLMMPATSRTSIRVGDDIPSGSVSAVVRSDRDIVVERSMYWGGARRLGGHNTAGVRALAPVWHLAEGVSNDLFDEFILVANPNDVATTVEVTYLGTDGVADVAHYPVAAASRRTIWARADLDVPFGGRFRNRAFSATVRSLDGLGIIAERALYWGDVFGGGPSPGGTNAAGVTAASTIWHFAEGFAGAGFQTFLLLANPVAEPAAVTVTFFFTDGTTASEQRIVAGRSRLNLWVNTEVAAARGRAFSMRVESTNGVGVVAERAMYWGGLREGHAVVGVVDESTVWAFAEGVEGRHGAVDYNSYFLLANAHESPAHVRALFLLEDGTGVQHTFTVPPRSRYTLATASIVELEGKTFGAMLAATNGTPFVAERAVYWGASYHGGHASAGTPWTGAVDTPSHLLTATLR